MYNKSNIVREPDLRLVEQRLDERINDAAAVITDFISQATARMDTETKADALDFPTTPTMRLETEINTDALDSSMTPTTMVEMEMHIDTSTLIDAARYEGGDGGNGHQHSGPI
ncbi:hypothetical protein CYMTET_30513 [Cymbomonas tetramitiformis]|uniref:Uncharacterized protein n=1 Tax=Cymbomonas tetramitiformis TaxID=36881 RepID=A0AAE0FIQ6_9CHLO|nr:hypothetical protein CYMTET_30513 [Cymbomonas tetramitiformis]